MISENLESGEDVLGTGKLRFKHGSASGAELGEAVWAFAERKVKDEKFFRHVSSMVQVV